MSSRKLVHICSSNVKANILLHTSYNWRKSSPPVIVIISSDYLGELFGPHSDSPTTARIIVHISGCEFFLLKTSSQGNFQRARYDTFRKEKEAMFLRRKCKVKVHQNVHVPQENSLQGSRKTFPMHPRGKCQRKFKN